MPVCRGYAPASESWKPIVSGMRKSEAVAAGDSGVPFTERAEPHTVAQCTVLV